MEQNPFVRCVDVHSIIPEVSCLTFIIYLRLVGHITFQHVLVKLILFTGKIFGLLFTELKIKFIGSKVGNSFMDLLVLLN
jgi:hypothetical protein